MKLDFVRFEKKRLIASVASAYLALDDSRLAPVGPFDAHVVAESE